MALRASRAERRAISMAMTVAPMLTAARIRRMVGKESTITTTPGNLEGTTHLIKSTVAKIVNLKVRRT
jgi:hypothetical protein